MCSQIHTKFNNILKNSEGACSNYFFDIKSSSDGGGEGILAIISTQLIKSSSNGGGEGKISN